MNSGSAAAPGQVTPSSAAGTGECGAHLGAAFVLWRRHVDERAANASTAWRNTRRKARHHVREARWCWRHARDIAA